MDTAHRGIKDNGVVHALVKAALKYEKIMDILLSESKAWYTGKTGLQL